MIKLYLCLFLDILFLAGTVPEFLGPPKRHIAQLQARRPEWSATNCRQFFQVYRTALAIITVVLTVYVVIQVREVAHR